MSLAYKKLGIEDFVIYTGQHRDYLMSEAFFKDFKMKAPDVYLEGFGEYGERLGKIVDGIIKNCSSFDFGVVYGDCDSTLAGALAIKKLGIPLVHIESGLRCGDNSMIEERNRVMVDEISDIRFCPTNTALCNVGCKGINSGNLLYELWLKVKDEVTSSWGGDYTLLTFHRQETLNRIAEVVVEVAQHKNVLFVCHPHTRKVLVEKGIIVPFKIIDPVTYLEMSGLIKGASLVVTDSGGIQQEAWLYEKKIINLRGVTEWIETNGACEPSIYGDGHASDIIAKYLRDYEKNKRIV